MAKRPTNPTRKRKRSAPDWAPKFLKELSQCGIVGNAARKAKVHRSTVYDRRDSDPEFARQLAEALENADDRLEDKARRRAEEESDRLMIFLLERRRYPKSSTVTHLHRGEIKAGVSDNLAERLAPYDHIIRTFFGSAGALRPHGPVQPVDTAPTNGQAGVVPPA